VAESIILGGPTRSVKEFIDELIASGLSIKVQGIKGPILEGELPRCEEFGNKVATQLKT